MSEDNGKLTDEQFLAISEIDIQDTVKYSDDDRKRYDELQAKARLERYQKDPYKFVELRDIVVCCIRNPQSGLGLSIYIGDCRRSEFGIANTELAHVIQKRLIRMDLESEMKHQAAKNLIVPKHGIMDFVKRRR